MFFWAMMQDTAKPAPTNSTSTTAILVVHCTDPFIYGEFDTRKLQLDGSLGIGLLPSYGVDVSGGGISKSQLHFSLDGTDTGGWITSNGENNFFLSSGAVWDEVNGGWVQKSSDLKAVIAGSGAMGYRVMTRSNCPVGTVCDATTRMHLKYDGKVGFGVAPSYPLHMANGAYVSAGGAWTDASSREYKDDIAELGADAAVKTLAGLNPVTFKYKAGEDERHVGFIAEDVPELVATKDRKGMSPMDVVAVLTKVVKEQQVTVKEQQEAIKDSRKPSRGTAAGQSRTHARTVRSQNRSEAAQGIRCRWEVGPDSPVSRARMAVTDSWRVPPVPTPPRYGGLYGALPRTLPCCNG